MIEKERKIIAKDKNLLKLWMKKIILAGKKLNKEVYIKTKKNDYEKIE